MLGLFAAFAAKFLTAPRFKLVNFLTIFVLFSPSNSDTLKAPILIISSSTFKFSFAVSKFCFEISVLDS